MNSLFPSRLFVFLVVVQVACLTVYQPPDAPVTEASLAEAIRTLEETDGRLEVLEDGFELEAYVYRWVKVPPPPRDPAWGFGVAELSVAQTQEVRMIRGPRRGVYVPFVAILSVEARSWPTWSGVEIAVSGPDGERTDSPLVIKAVDADEAARLVNAIDQLRRVRKPPSRD